MKHAIWILLLLLVSSGIAGADRLTIPPEVRQAFLHPSDTTLYTLDPDIESGGPQRFRGFRYVGRASLNPAQSAQVCRAVLRGISGRVETDSYHCFKPRHALKIGELEMLVCFECQRVHCFSPTLDWWGEIEPTPAPESLLPGKKECEALVNSLGIPVAGWVEQADGSWKHDLGISVQKVSGTGSFSSIWNDSSLDYNDSAVEPYTPLSSPTHLIVIDGDKQKRWTLDYLSPEAATARLLDINSGGGNVMEDLDLELKGTPEIDAQTQTVTIYGSISKVEAWTHLLRESMQHESITVTLIPVDNEAQALLQSESNELSEQENQYGEFADVPRGALLWHRKIAIAGVGPTQRTVTAGYFRSGHRYLVVQTRVPAIATPEQKKAVEDLLDSVRFHAAPGSR